MVVVIVADSNGVDAFEAVVPAKGLEDFAGHITVVPDEGVTVFEQDAKGGAAEEPDAVGHLVQVAVLPTCVVGFEVVDGVFEFFSKGSDGGFWIGHGFAPGGQKNVGFVGADIFEGVDEGR